MPVGRLNSSMKVSSFWLFRMKDGSKGTKKVPDSQLILVVLYHDKRFDRLVGGAREAKGIDGLRIVEVTRFYPKLDRGFADITSSRHLPDAPDLLYGLENSGPGLGGVLRHLASLYLTLIHRA